MVQLIHPDSKLVIERNKDDLSGYLVQGWRVRTPTTTKPRRPRRVSATGGTKNGN